MKMKLYAYRLSQRAMLTALIALPLAMLMAILSYRQATGPAAPLVFGEMTFPAALTPYLFTLLTAAGAGLAALMLVVLALSLIGRTLGVGRLGLSVPPTMLRRSQTIMFDDVISAASLTHAERGEMLTIEHTGGTASVFAHFLQPGAFDEIRNATRAAMIARGRWRKEAPASSTAPAFGRRAQAPARAY